MTDLAGVSRPSALRTLLAITLLAFPALASPNHQQTPTTRTAPALPNPTGPLGSASTFSLPLGQNRRDKRSAGAVNAWALREKARVVGKYLDDSPVRKRALEGRVERRQDLGSVDDSVSVVADARRASSSSSSRTKSGSTSRTSSSLAATSTTMVGLVNISNYEADL